MALVNEHDVVPTSYNQHICFSWKLLGDSSLVNPGEWYKLPCECGTLYIGETGRPLRVCVEEHKKMLKWVKQIRRESKPWGG